MVKNGALFELPLLWLVISEGFLMFRNGQVPRETANGKRSLQGMINF